MLDVECVLKILAQMFVEVVLYRTITVLEVKIYI
jgi:hypothetical protein